MYGCKARIGLMIVHSNAIAEPEFNAMAPEGVSVHVTRMLHERSIEGLKRMSNYTEEAAQLLAGAGVNIIAYTCTAGSFIGGFGWDEQLIRRIEETTGIPATTASSAVIRVFRDLRIKKVAVACPYRVDVFEAEKAFFEANGVEVTNIKSLDLFREGLRQAPSKVTYDLACNVDTPEADAVFISGTAFKSITVIKELEQRLQKHVFSSNTAVMYDILKRLGIHEQIKGYGSLLADL